jgi:hypothetical protein
MSGELPHRPPLKSELPAAPTVRRDAVISTFKEFQRRIGAADFEGAWGLLSRDCKDAMFHDKISWFADGMKGRKPQSGFYWPKAKFLLMEPRSVGSTDGVTRLAVTHAGERWTVDLVAEGGQMKIDWIAGYVPELVVKFRQERQDLLGQAEALVRELESLLEDASSNRADRSLVVEKMGKLLLRAKGQEG